MNATQNRHSRNLIRIKAIRVNSKYVRTYFKKGKKFAHAKKKKKQDLPKPHTL